MSNNKKIKFNKILFSYQLYFYTITIMLNYKLYFFT